MRLARILRVSRQDEPTRGGRLLDELEHARFVENTIIIHYSGHVAPPPGGKRRCASERLPTAVQSSSP